MTAATTQVLQEPTQEYFALLSGIAERVRTLRLERGLSLRDMVVRHGNHDSNYRRIERESISNLKSLLQLARALDVPLHELVDGLDISRSAARD